MNLEEEQAVWRRVRGPGNLTAAEAVLPDRLEDLILEQRKNAEELRQISGRLRGGERQVFQRMAADGESSARELTVLHYLLTGRRLRLKVPRQQISADISEALRTAYHHQRETERGLRGLAAEFKTWSSQLSGQEAAAQRNQKQIMRTLRNRLPEKT